MCVLYVPAKFKKKIKIVVLLKMFTVKYKTKVLKKCKRPRIKKNSICLIFFKKSINKPVESSKKQKHQVIENYQ